MSSWKRLTIALSVKHSKVDLIDYILQQCGNPNVLRLLSSFAVKYENLEIVKYLFEKYNAKGAYPCCVFFGKNLEIVKYLADELKISVHDHNEQYLRYCCMCKRYDLVKYLIENHNSNIWSTEENLNFNAIDSFFFKVNDKDPETVKLGKYLLQNCNGWVHLPRESLVFATRIVDLELMTHILQKLKRRCHSSVKESALLAACFIGRIEPIRLLLNYNVRLYANNHVALNVVLLYNHVNVYKYFIKYGLYTIWDIKWIASNSNVICYTTTRPTILSHLKKSITDEMYKLFMNIPKDIICQIYTFL